MCSDPHLFLYLLSRVYNNGAKWYNNRDSISIYLSNIATYNRGHQLV